MKKTVYQDINGNEILVEEENYTWIEVRRDRMAFLSWSDEFMIPDRFALFSEEQQTELLEYRRLLRNLPETYWDEEEEESYGANNAADNFPIQPEWLVD